MNELNSCGTVFSLDDSFIEKFVGKQPKWGPVGYVTYKRTYARTLDPDSVPKRIYDLGVKYGLHKSEEFWLTITRVVEGVYQIIQRHCAQLRLPWSPKRAQRDAQEMFRLMWEFKFSPPGRGLWMMGTDYVMRAGGAALNNCAFVSTKEIDVDFSAPFVFLMDMSMLGVGVGGDTRGAGKVKIVEPEVDQTPHVIADSREGWVGSLKRLLDAFVGKDTLPVSWDASLVRGKGMPIKGFGGTASGPEPLLEMLEMITKLLTKRIGKKLRSSDIVDIFNMIGRCVVAGNVRRSAEIMFGDPFDDDFLELKDPEKNLEALQSHRWASNNSIFAEVGQDYSKPAARTAKNGEPGYEWLENARAYGRMGWGEPDWVDVAADGGNPCLEQTLESFELCCLVETYPGFHKTPEEYQRTLKFAYLYAKAVTLVSTHDPRTNAVLLRNRRIGTSMSGIAQAIKRHGMRKFFNEFCDEGYRYLDDLDKEYSRWLCVPRSIKKTSVKPSGTVSLLCGATPGIHYPKDEYFFRVIRFDQGSPIVRTLRNAGYTCIDLDPKKEPNTTAVYFPVKEEFFDRSVKQISMWEQLELAAQMQHYWADNQVSVTIEFDKQAEGPQIAKALELYETRLKGVSFLPNDDHGYEHAPYQPISKEKYEEEIAKLLPYDLNEADNEVTDKFCDGDKCVIPVRKKAD